MGFKAINTLSYDTSFKLCFQVTNEHKSSTSFQFIKRHYTCFVKCTYLYHGLLPGPRRRGQQPPEQTSAEGVSPTSLTPPTWPHVHVSNGSNGQPAITGPPSVFTMPLSHSGLCINRVSFQVNDIFFIYFQIDQVIHSPPQSGFWVNHPPPPPPPSTS